MKGGNAFLKEEKNTLTYKEKLLDLLLAVTHRGNWRPHLASPSLPSFPLARRHPQQTTETPKSRRNHRETTPRPPRPRAMGQEGRGKSQEHRNHTIEPEIIEGTITRVNARSHPSPRLPPTNPPIISLTLELGDNGCRHPQHILLRRTRTRSCLVSPAKISLHLVVVLNYLFAALSPQP